MKQGGSRSRRELLGEVLKARSERVVYRCELGHFSPPHPPEVNVSPPRRGDVTKRFDKSDDFFRVGKKYYHVFFARFGNGKKKNAFSTII